VAVVVADIAVVVVSDVGAVDSSIGCPGGGVLSSKSRS